MKFNINNTSVGSIKISLGEGKGSINISNNEGIDSIAVDCAMQETRLCVIRNHRGNKTVNIYSLDEYKFEELAELMLHLITIGKPETAHIDSYGAGMAIKDHLYPRLLGKGIVITPSGKVSYGLDEIYGRLMTK
jgi:hypothetical protein